MIVQNGKYIKEIMGKQNRKFYLFAVTFTFLSAISFVVGGIVLLFPSRQDLEEKSGVVMSVRTEHRGRSFYFYLEVNNTIFEGNGSATWNVSKISNIKEGDVANFHVIVNTTELASLTINGEVVCTVEDYFHGMYIRQLTMGIVLLAVGIGFFVIDYFIVKQNRKQQLKKSSNPILLDLEVDK
ncbi:MAG: hypothetical protein LBU60_01345 [Clostridiales bacterium]|jgi:hypothetical protein|nr:hypothetical protein [Clostridiales bacterium]